MGRAGIHLLNVVVLTLFHAGNALSASFLGVVLANRCSLDISVLGVGDKAFLLGDKVLDVHLAADIFYSCSSFVAEFILYLLDFLNNDIKHSLVVCKDILKVCHFELYLCQFVDYLLSFKTCKSAQRHLCDVVSLYLGQTETLAKPFLSLWNIL